MEGEWRAGPLGLGVIFTDSHGIRWERSLAGVLEERRPDYDVGGGFVMPLGAMLGDEPDYFAGGPFVQSRCFSGAKAGFWNSGLGLLHGAMNAVTWQMITCQGQLGGEDVFGMAVERGWGSVVAHGLRRPA